MLVIPVSAQDHSQGPSDARITLVQYGDYECSNSERAHRAVQELQRRMPGRLHFVFRHFPLTEQHPYALRAALAAESVAAQLGDEGFWRMHDAIFDHQRDSARALDDVHLAEYATAAGADAERVLREVIDDEYVDRIEADYSGGVRSGVNNTPAFFINGSRHHGEWSNIDDFERALDSAGATARARSLP